MIKRTVGRPRGSNTDARREMIITAAIRVFAYRGYDAATVQEVADLVGITRPAIHHYFPGKAPLYRGALDRAYDIAMTPAGIGSERFTDPELNGLRMACALLGTSLAHSHRIADVAPRITGVSADLRRMCAQAVGRHDGAAQVDALVTTIVGRWVLTACDLTWIDLEVDVDVL
ncbi:TetR/AcrR family transcriptional regulator [Mycolicibacterium aichiense]|uniref:TetR/AcrR family transcriptional regulator n=1 Tax=Mycolicibacterium aichiense TaxID=1799 RepID=UPI0015588678|nr:helix-turn-helix domain-containing protein [Mycolicibacterium aichiense]